jgi:hypothetical protein
MLGNLSMLPSFRACFKAMTTVLGVSGLVLITVSVEFTDLSKASVLDNGLMGIVDAHILS